MPTLTSNPLTWRVSLAFLFGLLISVVSPSNAHAQDIWHVDGDSDEGLVAYFKFDEGTGTVSSSFPSLAITATLESGATYTTSVPSDFRQPNFHALDLDGSNDQASILNNSALNLLDTFSLVVWIKRSTADIDTASVIYDSGSSGARWYVGFLSNNTLTFTANDVADFQSPFTVTDTDWHHVAFVKDGDGSNNLTVYLDGAPHAINVGAITLPSGTKMIGNKQSGSSTPFGGQLDELRIYNRALSQTEVQRLANIGCAFDGTDWPNAFSDLQCGLASAAGGDEIWTAEGLYRPGVAVAASFMLTNSVALYGGFDGSEDSRSARDWQANPTVLSGDIDDNDTTDATDVVTDTANLAGTNAFHVVIGSNTGNSARLDGFIITAGSATGPLVGLCGPVCGGGLYNDGGSPSLANLTISGNEGTNGGGMANLNNSNPILADVQFYGNASAGSGGGGMLNRNSSPDITNTSFLRNVSGGGGGGIYNVVSSPTLKNVLFENNFAAAGGGMENTGGSNPLLTDVIFLGNRALGEGGGLKNLFAEATLVNVLFSGNHTDGRGGALLSRGSNSSPELINVTVSGNTAGISGGGLRNDEDSNPVLRNTLVWGNDAPAEPNNSNNDGGSLDLQFSLVEDITTADGNNNLDGSLDPRFVRLVDCGGDGCSDDPTTPATDESANDDYGDLRLLLTSPAVDAGNNNSVPVGVTSDLANNPRQIGSTVDLGAYEAPQPQIYVRQSAIGSGTGESWTNAFTTLQAGLQQAVPGSEIWVASGFYTPTARTDPDNPRSATFTLPPGVALFGGFVGAPGSEGNFAARDWEANLTILSGDLDDNDITDANGIVTDTFQLTGDNAFHVVTASNVTQTARLDGFVITAGRANNPIGNQSNSLGGGIYNVSSSPTLTDLLLQGNFALDGGGMIVESGSPLLNNVTFRNNRASTLGGGIFNPDGTPHLQEVFFLANIAEDSGGGMANVDSSATLTQVTFIANVAEDSGGGMLNRNSSPILTDSTFLSNTAEENGGGLFNDQGSNPTLTIATFRHNFGDDEGGGMANDNDSNPLLINIIFEGNFSEDGGGMSNLVSSPTLINVLFAGNRASADGGGMRNLVNANPILTNVTFSGNQGFDGGGMDNIGSSPFIQNTIFFNNQATDGPSINNNATSSPTVRFSIVEGGLPADTVDGGNNLDVDPLFTQPVNCGGDGLCADDLTTTDTDESADDDYGDQRLLPTSPAIDVGDNNVVTVATDLAGLPRIVAVRIVAPTVDLGAYETPNSPPAFISSPPLTATENVTYTYSISTADPNQPTGSGLVLNAPVLPPWLSFTDNGGGAGTLDGIPDPADIGNHQVTLQVQDTVGLTATQSFTITVANTNDAPFFTSTPTTAAQEGQTFSYAITTGDPDVGDSRTLSALVKPTWLILTDTGNGSGTLNGTPAAGDVGDHPVTLQVQDAGGLTSTQSFTVTVSPSNNGNNGNNAPSFTSTPVTNAVQDAPYTYTITTTDPDVGDSRSLSALVKPTWLTLTDNGDGSGTLNGTPTAGDVGNHPVTLQVQDTSGLTGTQSFTVIVTTTPPNAGGLVGQVTADGTGVPGVTVSVNNDAATSAVSTAAVIAQDVTDAQGNYSFSGLTPGPYTLTFAPPTGFITPSAQDVVVEAGTIKTVSTVALERSPTDTDNRLFLPSLIR